MGFEDLTRQSGRRAFLWNAEAATGRAVLAEMARVSGRVSYFPETENEPELVGICLQIATELREQYTFGFYPNGRATTNNWHRIRVKVNTATIALAIFGFKSWFRYYSIAIFVVVLLSATLSFLYVPRVAANQASPGFGLAERVAQYAHQSWHAVLAILLLHRLSDHSTSPPTGPPNTSLDRSGGSVGLSAFFSNDKASW